MGTGAGGVYFAGGCAIKLHVEVVAVVITIEQGNIQVLPAPGFFPVQQGAGDGAQAVHAGHDITNTESGQGRRPVWLTNHMGNARECLGDKIVARSRGKGAGLAKGGN